MSNHKPVELKAYESPYWAGNFHSGQRYDTNSLANSVGTGPVRHGR